MIDGMRVLVVLARLPVVLLLGLFTATGLAHAGAGNDPVLLAKALVVVLAFLLCSAVVNDLADEAVDRVNVPDAGRPLVAGTSGRSEMVGVAVVSGVAAVAGSLLLGPLAVAVTVAGLVLSLAYSLPPVRLADRGALASLLLPAG